MQMLRRDMDAVLFSDAPTASVGGFVPSQLPFDIATDAALLTTCHIVESMAENMQLGASEAELFQLNGVHVQPLQDDNVLTKDSSRIFFLTRALDYSGGTMVGVTEEAALELSGCADRDTFLSQAKNRELQFPALATVRLVRSVRDLKSARDAADAADAGKVVNAVVIKAAHYSIEELPSKAVDDLLGLLACTSAATDGLLPCQLHRVTMSPHYGFQIDYGNNLQSCVGAPQEHREKRHHIYGQRLQSDHQRHQGWQQSGCPGLHSVRVLLA